MVAVAGYDVPVWLGLVVPGAYMLWRAITPSYDYFKEIGVPYVESWPILGNLYALFKNGLMAFDDSLRQKYGKIVGLYEAGKPMLMVYDLDLLNEILVKNFHNFQNHKVNGLSEYPMRKMLTEIEFDHWKHVRNQLSPTFSGGKLRRMNETVNNCARNMVSALKRSADAGEVIELKREAGKFGMDFIAGTAFGIDINSFSEEDNAFAANAKKIMDFFTGGLSLKLLMFIMCPKLMSYAKISVFDKETMDFFMVVINQALKNRGESVTEKSAKDFLQLMVCAHVEDPKEGDLENNDDLVKTKEGFIYSKKGLTHEEILAQSFMFFLAGFDTTSTQLSFLCFNLACYPEAQEKVYQEIKEAMGDLKEPNYDVIKQMSYLQMCIDETSRLYPSVPRSDRMCNGDVEINGILIKNGTVIGLPIWTIHHDPEIYPEPYKFIPERFSAEEKAERHPMAWLPFGQGPRNCVGMRLGLMVIKFAVIHLLMNFKLVTCPETDMQLPLPLAKIKVEAINGLKIKLEARN